MNRRFFIGLLSGAILPLLAVSSVASAREKTDAKLAVVFIQALGEEAIAVLGDSDAPLAAREADVQNILRKYLDLAAMGRFVLGGKWKMADASERNEYLTLFSDYVVRSYARRLGGYSSQTFDIRGSGPAGKYDALIETAITQAGAAEIRAGWRVKTLKDGSMKIVDLVVEGISMLQTERAQFGSILQSGGLSGLMTSLRSQLDKFSARSS